jgi:hypothetical protein
MSNTIVRTAPDKAGSGAAPAGVVVEDVAQAARVWAEEEYRKHGDPGLHGRLCAVLSLAGTGLLDAEDLARDQALLKVAWESWEAQRQAARALRWAIDEMTTRLIDASQAWARSTDLDDEQLRLLRARGRRHRALLRLVQALTDLAVDR